MIIIGTPHTHNAGYYRNDDTVSGGRLDEADIQTCPHCQAVLKMQEWKKVENGKMTGGFCMKCSKPVCGFCNKEMQTRGCVPFMQKLDQYFDATVKFDRFLKDAGLEPASARPIFTGLLKE